MQWVQQWLVTRLCGLAAKRNTPVVDCNVGTTRRWILWEGYEPGFGSQGGLHDGEPGDEAGREGGDVLVV